MLIQIVACSIGSAGAACSSKQAFHVKSMKKVRTHTLQQQQHIPVPAVGTSRNLLLPAKAASCNKE